MNNDQTKGRIAEVKGKVKEVAGQLVLIGELANKEYFDAVVATKSIVAVIVRAK